MRNAHAVAEVRKAERALMASLPAGTLMQRAAAGLASVGAGLLGRVYGARVAVLAGSGDNGGDALYAGARLAARGAVVTAVAAGSRVHPGGAEALLGAGGRLAGTAAPERDLAIETADLVIDGLLGIGGRGGLREPGASLAATAERARRRGAVVVAADLPSGVDADTGEVPGAAVRADVTVTFGTWKPGLLVDPGAGHTGVTTLVDIGLGGYLGEPAASAPQGDDIAGWLPRPGAESDKYRRGVLGILAGGERFTGAAVLATGGAVHGGAGMVRLLTAPAAAAVVRERWPEAVVTVLGQGSGLPAGDCDGAAGDPAEVIGGVGGVIAAAGRVQAWVVGPGMGTGEREAGLLAAVLATDLPVLVDADGLTLLARHRGLLPRGVPTLVTPHAGELARLLHADRSDIEARRLEFARRAAAQLGATVLLKGSTTVVADPDGACAPLVNPTGTGWLATAGSGDVLSGLAGALLAQGLTPQRAGAAAAYLHGLAARRAAGGAPIGASDVLDGLPDGFRAVAER